MARGAVAAMLLGGCVAWACSVTNAFTCAQDSQCGGDGVCQPTGGCSFPDDTCPSGQRYGDFAPSGLGGLCVDATSETDSGSTSVQSGSTTSTSTSASGPATLDDTGATPSTSGMESTSSSGSPTTTDALTTGPTTSDTGVGESSTGPPSGDPTLLLWFQFDDGLADPISHSGSLGVEGECLDGACPEAVSGVLGDAASFEADAAGVGVPHVGELALPNGFTLAAWLQSGVLDSSPHSIVAKTFGDANFNSFNFVFTTAPGENQMDWEIALYLNTTSTADFVYADYDFGPDEWVHVTAVWDGTFASIYVGGALFAAEPLPEPGFDDNPLTIGFDVNSGTPGQFYNGAIDDLRLYSRALDPDEIAELADPSSQR